MFPSECGPLTLELSKKFNMATKHPMILYRLNQMYLPIRAKFKV